MCVQCTAVFISVELMNASSSRSTNYQSTIPYGGPPIKVDPFGVFLFNFKNFIYLYLNILVLKINLLFYLKY